MYKRQVVVVVVVVVVVAVVVVVQLPLLLCYLQNNYKSLYGWILSDSSMKMFRIGIYFNAVQTVKFIRTSRFRN